MGEKTCVNWHIAFDDRLHGVLLDELGRTDQIAWERACRGLWNPTQRLVPFLAGTLVESRQARSQASHRDRATRHPPRCARHRC